VKHFLFVILPVVTLVLTSCITQAISSDDLYPPSVGTFLRTEGPNLDTTTGMDRATFGGNTGVVILQTKRIGEANMEQAIGKLPLGAIDAGPDPALGQRTGVFFSFDGKYHAAWGNGDWLFIISADTPEARNAFLAGYSY
jgi:hypothetical protein